MAARLVAVQRADEKWGWKLYGDNGSDIIATDGNQGYENVTDALEMATRVISGHYAKVEQRMIKLPPKPKP